MTKKCLRMDTSLYNLVPLYWMLLLEGLQSTIQIFSVNNSSYTAATLFVSGLNNTLKKYLLRIRLSCIVCHLQENKIFSCVRKSNKGWRVEFGRLAHFCFLRRLKTQSRYKWARKQVGRGPEQQSILFEKAALVK